MSNAQQFYLTISSIPIWVWPLFILLVFVGMRSASTRAVPITVLYFIPLIGLAVIRTLVDLGDPLFVLPVFMTGYFLGGWFGYRYQRRLFVGVEGTKVVIRGEWLTMALAMTLFISNFSFGMLSAIQPEFAGSTGFLVVFLSIIGFCAGAFLGRCLYSIQKYRSGSLKVVS